MIGIDLPHIKPIAEHAVSIRIGAGCDRGRVGTSHRRKDRVAVEEIDAFLAQTPEVRSLVGSNRIGPQPVEHHHDVERGFSGQRDRPGLDKDS